MAADYVLVHDPPEELTCSICIKVLCQPHMVNCCEQQFCEECLERWLLKSKTCPHCRQESFHHMPMQQTNRKIGELKVYCPNKQHGCKVVLKVSECEQHLSTTNDRGCLYVKLKCPNSCTAEVFRGEMRVHVQEKCPRRQVLCPHCKFGGEYQHMEGHVIKCPLHPLPCPRGCKNGVLRKDLEDHRRTCPLELVSCPLHEIGCESVVYRKDLAKHEETSALKHMTVLAKSHMTLSAKHTALEIEHTALKKEHVSLVAKHSALEKNYIAEKESYAAKVKLIEPVIKRLPCSPDNCHLAQISTILADPSYVKLGDAVNLVFSEGNEESGSHHFVYTHQNPQYELKFRLEWERVCYLLPNFQFHYKFKLYSIMDFPAIVCGLNLDVEITFISAQSVQSTRLARMCCYRPQDRLEIGTVDYKPEAGKLCSICINYNTCMLTCCCQCHPHLL